MGVGPQAALAAILLTLLAGPSTAGGRGYVTCKAENYGHLEYEGYQSAIFPGHCDPQPGYASEDNAMCVEDGWPAAQFVGFVRRTYGPTTHITCFESDRAGVEEWRQNNIDFANRMHQKSEALNAKLEAEHADWRDKHSFTDTGWKPE